MLGAPEVSAEEVVSGFGSTDVSGVLSADVVEAAVVSDDMCFRVLVSTVPHTVHVLVSVPSSVAVGAFVVTQLPNLC